MRCRHRAKRFNQSMANAGLLGLMLSVGGCAVGPDFETPEARVQNNWIEKHDLRVETKSDIKSCGGRAFSDPTLDELIERASEQNLPVQIAGFRILEARAQLGVAIGNMYPQNARGLRGCTNRTQLSSRLAESSQASHIRSVILTLVLTRPGNWISGAASGETSKRQTPQCWQRWRITTMRLSRLRRKSLAPMPRCALSRCSFKSLIKTSKIQKEGLEIAQSRFRNGATSELDVTQARTLLESTLADIPRATSQIFSGRKML